MKGCVAKEIAYIGGSKVMVEEIRTRMVPFPRKERIYGRLKNRNIIHPK